MVFCELFWSFDKIWIDTLGFGVLSKVHIEDYQTHEKTKQHFCFVYSSDTRLFVS